MQNKEVIQQAIAHWCGLLKKHRILAGLSQREVGEKMAKLQNREKPFGRQYIHKIESGKESIGLDVMFRYCDAIGARAELELIIKNGKQ